MNIQKIGPAIFLDPEFDKNFNFGIYESEEGKYSLAYPLSFQSTEDLFTKVGGELRDRPYFMIEGRDIPEGRRLIEKIVLDYNANQTKSLEELKSIILEKLPRVQVYSSHEESIKAGAERMRTLAKKIGHLEGEEFYNALKRLSSKDF